MKKTRNHGQKEVKERLPMSEENQSEKEETTQKPIHQEYEQYLSYFKGLTLSRQKKEIRGLQGIMKKIIYDREKQKLKERLKKL